VLTDDLALYDYNLPDELIARQPALRREEARLMIVDRATETVQHRLIADLPESLRAGDCLVLNDTRVVPARLLGKRAHTGGRWEGLFLELTANGEWRLLSQCRGKLQSGEFIEISPAHEPHSSEKLLLQLGEREEDGIWHARPANPVGNQPVETWAALDKFGSVPLPPYMRRDLAEKDDFERYQTVYARHRGSVAAPTAGLHFTPELLARCTAREIAQAYITLHVGIGTFRPIAVDRLDAHRMHSEWCDVGAEAIGRIDQTATRGGRRIAVGTTTARALESAARGGHLVPWRGATDLFIRPPHEFRAIDGLLTNFHLPRSTLLVLVCTFAGRDLIMHAYSEAIRQNYRFYSYGDAMLIV
jgi:S-adenosylmethionine:tRNA ribosyltransferase-isomerase